MIQIRKANERGGADHGWLNTRHTFSFAEYHDPRFMGFRSLRVINEDRVAPGQGFGMHAHREMEIVTYVLEGALEHKDSLGHGAVLRPGQVQRISAGKGILHSEFNPSATEGVHFYQIWLLPNEKGLPPEYAEAAPPPSGRQGRWQVVASPDGREQSLRIHQDATLWLATLQASAQLAYPLQPTRHGWLQVLRGSVALADNSLSAGDGAALSEHGSFSVRAIEPAEVLFFDLA